MKQSSKHTAWSDCCIYGRWKETLCDYTLNNLSDADTASSPAQRKHFTFLFFLCRCGDFIWLRHIQVHLFFTPVHLQYICYCVCFFYVQKSYYLCGILKISEYDHVVTSRLMFLFHHLKLQFIFFILLYVSHYRDRWKDMDFLSLLSLIVMIWHCSFLIVTVCKNFVVATNLIKTVQKRSWFSPWLLSFWILIISVSLSYIWFTLKRILNGLFISSICQMYHFSIL